MLTVEQNERITRVGPGTPMGEVFRRYWIPALLAEEVAEPDSPPVKVKLLGEELVAFRDSTGQVGLVDAYCPHRRAPLYFGRNEEAGIRCVYHGWKFDCAGTCVDMPSEPDTSVLKTRVSLKAYPTYEAAGIVFTYMGPRGQMPEVPDYEFLRAPAAQRRVSKTNEACNWLQALEGGVDSAHVSYVHNDDLENTTTFLQLDKHPRLEVEETAYGFRYSSTRDIGDGRFHVNCYQFILPCMQIRGGGAYGGHIAGHFWVPMDDYNVCVYNTLMEIDDSTEITDEAWEEYEHRAGRSRKFGDYIEGTYWLKANPSNDYFIDRELQRTKTFTGIRGVNTQDYAVQETMERIVDRSKEALGTSDKAIQKVRRLFLEACAAVEAGDPPRGVDPLPSRAVRSGSRIISKDERWQDALAADLAARW